MMKLFVLVALLSLAAARPSILTPLVVGSVPTAVSHQSHTQIHSSALVAPVVHPVVPIVSSHLVAGPLVAHPLSPLLVHG